MTERLTPIDRELIKMEDSVLQEHRDGYYHLLEGLGFLTCSYFAGVDGQRVSIGVNLGGKQGYLDGEELLMIAIPRILVSVAERLVDMGEEGYVEAMNEIVAQKWQGKI